MISKAYACYNLNETTRKRSSSGGIYPLIAEAVLCEGGVVYAACYDDKLDVRHERIEKLEKIIESQGSKYVASFLGSTFSDVVKDAQTRKVLFVGTPCQCAGLESFIQMKKADRSKIIMIDFICHGIPSNKAWNAYKRSMKNKGMELTQVNMRDKTTGWTRASYAWRERTAKGETITPRQKVSYMNGMLANLYLRPSCFSCAFKGVERCTDITLGDYWGVQEHLPEMDDNKGTSLMLVHTTTGNDLVNRLSSKMRITEANLESAIQHNRCMIESTPRSPLKTVFYTRLNRGEDFITLVNDLTKESVFNRIKRKTRRLKDRCCQVIKKRE